MRHGSLERAAAETERDQLFDLRLALLDEVEARDAAVDDSVLNVLGDIRGAHEQDVDGCVSAREGEGAIARALRAEAGVLEQPDGRLA